MSAWRRRTRRALTVTLANLVYFEKSALPQALANRLIRLAAFQNSEFYKAQAMRMSVWDKPRVIGSAENYPQHIALATLRREHEEAEAARMTLGEKVPQQRKTG